MNRKVDLSKIRNVIFILLILCAFGLVIPLHNKLSKAVDNLTEGVLNLVEEKSNLIFSYESLSPSILSTMRINGIKVETKDSIYLGEIRKVKISYHLLQLIKLDLRKGISNVTVDGVHLEIDNLIDYIQSFDYTQEQIKDFDVSLIKKFIPASVKVKNVFLTYANTVIDTSLTVKDVSVSNTNKDSLTFSIDSLASAELKAISEKIKGNINLSGTIYKNLDNSNVTIKLSDVSDGKVGLKKINLLASYKENQFEAHTIQTVNPIYIAADYNLNTFSGNATLKTQDINLLSLVTLNVDSKQLKKFKSVTIDTESLVSFNVKDVNKPLINYSSRGNVFIPDELFTGTASVDYSVSGNQNDLNIKQLTITGEKCAVNMELGLNFNNLQLNGFAEIPYFLMPNGNYVSTELYFDPLDKGFLAFSPQLFIGDKALTALQFSMIPQKDSYDFNLEAYDYSHAEEGEPGSIKIDGSYLNTSRYIQTNLALNSLYLDSLLNFGIQAVNKEVKEKLVPVEKQLKPYIFSADTYISTDFKSVSYSIPYLLLANTQVDNQVLLLTANGNEQSVQLDKLSLVYGKYGLQAAGAVDMDKELSELFYTLDLNFASIPYHFSGNVMKEMITVNGDYGINAQLRFKNDKKMDGFAFIENLPFSIDNNSFIFSLDSSFEYDTENGPNVRVSKISLETISSSYTVSPKILASGNITKYGAQMDSITYTDFYSTLDGTADVMVNVNEGLFDSVGLILNVKNPVSEETISIDANVSNPELVQFNAKNLLSSLYLSSQVQIHNFNLNRFTTLHNEHNLLSASLFATGTIEHPYVALTVENINILMSTDFWNVSGIAILEDKNLSIQDFIVGAPGFSVKNINADISLENFVGNASAIFKLEGPKDLLVPIKLSLRDTIMPSKGFIPTYMTGDIEVANITGKLVKKPFDFSVGLIYADKLLSFFSSENLGAYGTLSFTDKKLNCSVNNNNALKLNVTGNFNKENLELKLSDINIQLPQIFEYLNFDDVVKVKNGLLKGSFAIKDSFDDPNYKGALMITDPSVNLPMVFKHTLSTDKVLITAVNNVVQLLDTNFALNNVKKIQTGATLYFNKWAVDHIDVKLKSIGKESIPLALNLPILNFYGDIMCDINMGYQADRNGLILKGKVFGDNINVSSKISDLSQNLSVNPDAESDFAITTNLDISFGTHVSLTFDPVLRAVFAPNTKIVLLIDSDANLYKIDGELNLKSGDIAYLNRNFYIKSGSIKFNPVDLGNPLITIQAETRERDEKGNNVKIILSADNQYLLTMTPRFTSDPAKSEMEIQQLLGQIITADSTKASSFIMAASDYALQSLLWRKSENKLRDLLNFDIFSLRTNVLQNSVNLTNSEYSNPNNILGNLLDNSTVYIGKYIGSNLYFDAMLQLRLDDVFTQNFASPGTLLLQPEFGMELESPFGNIRWNMAPDINALLHNEFVPSASVSLSWKFSF